MLLILTSSTYRNRVSLQVQVWSLALRYSEKLTLIEEALIEKSFFFTLDWNLDGPKSPKVALKYTAFSIQFFNRKTTHSDLCVEILMIPNFSFFYLRRYSKSYFSVKTGYIPPIKHQNISRQILVVAELWNIKKIDFLPSVGIFTITKNQKIAHSFDIFPLFQLTIPSNCWLDFFVRGLFLTVFVFDGAIIFKELILLVMSKLWYSEIAKVLFLMINI